MYEIAFGQFHLRTTIGRDVAEERSGGRAKFTELRASSIFQAAVHVDSVNSVGLIAVDSVSGSRIHLTGAERWQYGGKTRSPAQRARSGRKWSGSRTEEMFARCSLQEYLSSSIPAGERVVRRKNSAKRRCWDCWGKERNSRERSRSSKNINNHSCFHLRFTVMISRHRVESLSSWRRQINDKSKSRGW